MARFRLPTANELETLIDHTRPGTDIFGINGWFWSGERHFKYGSGYAVGVHFSCRTAGATGASAERDGSVRLVRADHTLPALHIVEPGPMLTDNCDGTHTDRRTGLIWQSEPIAVGVTWEQAITAYSTVDIELSPGTVAVPVTELIKLEAAREQLYEYLEDKLTERELLGLVQATGQIWRVANRRNWSTK